MQQERIRFLLNQYISGELSESEQLEFSSILAGAEYGQMVQDTLRQMLESSGTEPQTDRHPVLDRVLAIDKTGKSGRIAFFRRTPLRWTAAAALLLTASAIGYREFQTRRAPKPVAAIPAPAKNDIAPGSNRAILTLAGGKQIILTGAQNGLLSQQGNTKVIKLANGQLAYDAKSGANGTALADGTGSLYNTITTPRGGQYQITLPDGTRVWLNSASSLRFPAAFSGKERAVDITGEAYFEVAPDKAKPFIVRAGQTQTRVIGTHFDIMAYTDEKAIRTTLLEGSVSMAEGGLSTLIKPGEQGAFDPKAGTLSTKNVNVRAAVAWKDGYYYFDRTKMEDVMRQIARWYDVDIVYQGGVPQDEIVGKIPRTAYVSEVLHIMELIGIRFRIEGKKIIVLS